MSFALLTTASCALNIALPSLVDLPVVTQPRRLSPLQPVAVSVDANGGAWQFYSGGVLTSHCGKQLDHAVLATGYGTDGSNDYYTVKNSWGTDWGVNGYILIARGAAFNPSGQCGIQTGSSWPVSA